MGWNFLTPSPTPSSSILPGASYEYGLLLKDLSSCAAASQAVGDCVDKMLTAAALGLQGKAGSVHVRCADSSAGGICDDCAAARP